jgi:hypothetical protein
MPPDRPPVAEDAAELARRRDRLMGLSVVAVAFVIALIISWWAKLKSEPDAAAPPAPPTTAGIAGYPSAVDPVQVLGVARTLTKRTLLRRIVAEGVKSDGTVNVSDGSGRVRYVFQSPPGEGPQPLRERQELLRHPYCGEQTLRLGRGGLVAEPDLSDIGCDPRRGDALPEPRCGLREVWRHALDKTPHAGGLARIEYYRSDAGPAWRFTGSGQTFTLYGDCGRELEPAERLDSTR